MPRDLVSPHWYRWAWSWFGLLPLWLAMACSLSAQTASTGALAGVAMDASGAVVPSVSITLARNDQGGQWTTTSDEKGQFRFDLLQPGQYDLRASRPSFETLTLSGLNISVTETLQVELHLRLATHSETAQVNSGSVTVQTETSALGRVVGERQVSDLPLATRNFAQIAGLSPGVFTGANNAGELGLGGTALSQINKSNDGIFVHGARSYDNNWILNGISVTDVQATSSASGGIPTPNPDTIEEFKVQTGLYNAGYGRSIGANISIVTKEGSNDFHGSVFEFLRNNTLNAKDYFSFQRQDLNQNQFGFVFGGPIKKHRMFFFGSYQGTYQVNGVSTGQARTACAATLTSAPLTNDRSREELGKLFGDQTGALGGVAVKSDGSNISQAAINLLNLKLPDGSFLIPTPQEVDSTLPFAQQGFSVFSYPCHFEENQGMANLDYVISPKSRFSESLFFANDDQSVTFPGNFLNASDNVPGFTSPGNTQFAVLSLAHTYTSSGTLINEARFGYVRTRAGTGASAPFSWSDVGVSEGAMNKNNDLPSLSILGSVSMAPALPRTYTQNSFSVSDDFSILHGLHTLRFGASLTRLLDNLIFAGAGSFLEFLSWPDFLLGLNAAGNGTQFSNVFGSFDLFGLLDREYRVWEGAAFAQDDFRATPSLTLNLGVRYEHPGQFGDELGRNSSFDFNLANTNPPPSGSLAGNILSSNFAGLVPPGVLVANNRFGNYGKGQNTIAPRLGFAWQFLPNTYRWVLRGGYGIFYSRPTGVEFTQSVESAPFALARLNSGKANAAATFEAPFAQPFPTPSSFPLFEPYSPGTIVGVSTTSPYFRPAMVQQVSLNVQGESHRGWLFEVGYVGSRGTFLPRTRSLNQAGDASPSNPINGVTQDTVANIGMRVPIPGIPADSLIVLESEGNSWFNGLEASLTKYVSHGLQFLASYTLSRTMDTDGADINGTAVGNALTLGDQNSNGQRWGRASFDRTHRFVFSSTWTLPGPHGGVQKATLAGWNLAAIVVIQSGSALTISDTNANNVFGISEDRAQIAPGCSNKQLLTAGPIESRLNNYFNTSCLTSPPVIGADGIGTGFGDSRTGIVNGPGQASLDLAVTKAVSVFWPNDKSEVELRAEFFNALNHPQFANPDTNFSSPTFGVINSTAVNARVGQFALRLSF